jgi:hypothetical protein
VILLPDCAIERVDDRTPPDVARALQRRAGSDRTRIARGVYVDTATWQHLDDREQHLVRMLVVHPTMTNRAAFTHESALLLHGVRLLHRAPDRVVVGDPAAARADRRSVTVERRPMPPGTISTATLGTHHIRTLDLAAAAAAFARTADFRAAVVVLDQVLRRGIPREALDDLIVRAPARGRTRARAALAFADPRSDSVGESLARIVLHDAGAPTPELQREFRTRDGLVARVDFWFPEQGVVVEYDGAVKYRDPGARGGRSASRVVEDEKRREDLVRAFSEVRGFVRLTSHDLRSVPYVAAVLRSAGIPARA